MNKKMIQIQKIDQVCQKTCLSKSSIYNKISDGTFPPQISLGKRSVAFISGEIDLWIIAITEGKSIADLKSIVENIVDSRTRKVEVN